MATDADGGLTFDDFAFDEQPEVEEPIFFDQTTRHMGSIQKNMVLTDSHKNMLFDQGFGRPKGMQQGFNPASTMPNYSGLAGQNQATYKNGAMQRNPQSIMNGSEQSSYRMTQERLANQYADVDAP